MVHYSVGLLLLTCLPGFCAILTEQNNTTVNATYGPSSVVISGVDVVTVGIFYGFQCSANCSPSCQFTWTWGNETTKGPVLILRLLQTEPTLNLTCTADNPTTNNSVTAQKTLQVAGGPSNIQISGPEVLPTGTVSNFTCSADCYPSCNYTFSIIFAGVTSFTVQGSTVSIIPIPGTIFGILTCKAQDTISHLYISKTLPFRVTMSDSSLSSHPEETSALLLLGFIISAVFTLRSSTDWIFP